MVDIGAILAKSFSVRFPTIFILLPTNDPVPFYQLRSHPPMKKMDSFSS